MKHLPLLLVLTAAILSQPARAGELPVSLSGPIPAVASQYMPSGVPTTLTYTISNNVTHPLPITVEGLSAPVSRIPVPGDCGNNLPAATSPTVGATCNLGIQIMPQLADAGKTININLQINYPFRPFATKRVIQFSVAPVTLTVMGANSLLPPRIPVGAAIPFTAQTTFPDHTTRDVTSLVTWHSSMPGVATITAQGGKVKALALGNTNITAQLGSTISPAVPLTVRPTVAYIAGGISDNLSPVSSCNVNGTTGALESCVKKIFTGYYFSNSIAINPSGTYAYFINGEDMTRCSIKVDGSLGDCEANFSPPPALYVPSIAINPAGTYAYITSYKDSKIYACPITANGNFGTCNMVNTDITYVQPLGIAINSTGDYLYTGLTSQNNDVSVLSACHIDTPDKPQNCLSTGTVNLPKSESSLSSIAVNSSNTYAYIVYFHSTNVVGCAINSANGSLKDCTSTPVDWSVNSMSLNPQGNLMYLTSWDTNGSVYVCSVNGAAPGSCNIASGTGGEFEFPIAITLY